MTNDPFDPQARKALRESGAPDWFPQNAEHHETKGTMREDTGTITFLCDLCSYKLVVDTNSDDFKSLLVDEGDRWAIHSGTTVPQFGVISVEHQQVSDLADSLFNFLGGDK